MVGLQGKPQHNHSLQVYRANFSLCLRSRFAGQTFRGEKMLPERTGYIVWVSDLKAARSLERFGTVHYMSRKMHYVVMYMNAERSEEAVRQMGKLSYVRKIERSYRNEIKTEYSKDSEDKTRFYSL
jgi:uncharacterized protein YlbG (UPF0298 family)